MEAYIVKSLFEGALTLKSPFQGVDPVVLVNGGDYLFKSPEEFVAYKPQVDRLVHAKLVVLEVVKQVESKSVAFTAPLVKEAVAVKKDDAQDASADDVQKDELKAELKYLQDNYRHAKDEEAKEELKLQIIELKAKIKEL
jgi:hypothetical protein